LATPTAASDAKASPLELRMAALLDWPINGFEAVGALVLFAVTAVWRARKRPLRWAVYIQQMQFVGVGSLGIILLTGAFTGAVFAIQTSVAFDIFKAKSLIGGSVALALVLELAPTIGALMVAGRVGSAMTTEIGTMRVTEQIDALETMAVDPLHYLIAPRIVACTLMMPLLTIAFNTIGLGGAYLVSLGLLGVDHAGFFSRIYEWVVPTDILCTVVKGTAFGALIASTVVTASVAVLIVDYVITSAWMVLYPVGGN
jgi:phospholipid/cholesterol/gamma-HCH transport system permease protein